MKLIENAPVFDTAHHEPLEIRVELARPPVFYQPPMLDSLLAWSVVHEATQGKGLPETPEPYLIPLPLNKLWTCPKTQLPLWDATQFIPIGENQQQSAYWHKRGYNPELLKKTKKGTPHNANFGQGRHKEYRMPMPLQSALEWKAYARGDAQEIAKLLIGIATLSKKRSQGYGKVIKWHIEKIDDFPYYHEAQLIKPFPVGSPIPKFPDGVIYNLYESGWTPPYWLETIFKTCFV